MYKTLAEVVEALRGIDKGAALYIERHFDEHHFETKLLEGGPLDFFAWSDHPYKPYSEWLALNRELMELSREERGINLDDYETEPIDYTGCHPVIAEALKQNKSIRCKVFLAAQKYTASVIAYNLNKRCPYVSENGCLYQSAKPIKRLKTETRVKGPVECMQWLVDNGFKPDGMGIFKKRTDNREFDFRAVSMCNKKTPDWWDFPELLEEVEI